jgi:hypothetical protein
VSIKRGSARFVYRQIRVSALVEASPLLDDHGQQMHRALANFSYRNGVPAVPRRRVRGLWAVRLVGCWPVDRIDEENLGGTGGVLQLKT